MAHLKALRTSSNALGYFSSGVPCALQRQQSNAAFKRLLGRQCSDPDDYMFKSLCCRLCRKSKLFEVCYKGEYQELEYPSSDNYHSSLKSPLRGFLCFVSNMCLTPSFVVGLPIIRWRLRNNYLTRKHSKVARNLQVRLQSLYNLHLTTEISLCTITEELFLKWVRVGSYRQQSRGHSKQDLTTTTGLLRSMLALLFFFFCILPSTYMNYTLSGQKHKK